MSFTVLVLDPNEEPLEYLDSEQLEIEETSEKGELKTVTLTYPLGEDIHKSRENFKIGNKLWVPGGNGLEPCLYINTSQTKIDYWQDNSIESEFEEILVQLNYLIFKQRSNENVTIVNYNDTTKTYYSSFFEEEFGDYFEIEKVEPPLSESKKKIALNGTMTKLELLRFIEEETGNIFITRYEKEDNSNVIHCYLSFLQPNSLGEEKDVVIDLSFNAENIEYELEESDTYKAIAPLFSLDSNVSGGTTDVTHADLQKVINNWLNLAVKKGSQIPMIIEKMEGTSYPATPSNPTNFYWTKITDDSSEKKQWNQGTAYWSAPFEKRKNELFIRDDVNTEVQYTDVKSMKKSAASDLPKCGTIETSETDPYVIFNHCATTLMDKRYSGINLEVDLKDIEQVTSGNTGFNLYDRVKIKVPDLDKPIKAQVIGIVKNPQLPGETKVTLGNANVGARINQLATKMTNTGPTTVKYKKGQSVKAKLTENSNEVTNGTAIKGEVCTIFIHRDETKITQNQKITTKTVTQVKGDTTTVKTYENGKLIKTVKKVQSGNKLTTYTTQNGKTTTKTTTTSGSTVTKNPLDRDVSNGNSVSKATKSTRVGSGKKTWSPSADNCPILTVTGKPGVSTSVYSYKVYKKTWLNWCPFCGRIGSLAVNPKHVPEGELTCTCDADFDMVTGLDKAVSRRKALRDIKGNNFKSTPKSSVGSTHARTGSSNNTNKTTTKTTTTTKPVTTTIPAMNKSYSKTTNNNGEISLKINLAKGDYKVTFSYGGSIEYGASSRTINLKVT